MVDERKPMTQTGIFCLLVAVVVLAGGCGGTADPGSIVDTPQEQPAGAPLLLNLPAPSQLAGLAGAPRRSSYVETGLIRHGKDYEEDFPKRNVSKVGETASFSPSWSPGTGLGPENLAFCVFEFSAEGFDRDPQVRYGWEIAPAADERTYLGLSHWEHDSWEWFLLSPAGYRPFASLEPYISMTGLALAVVVQTGTEISRLRYIRLGPQQLTADLTASPASGLFPMDVHLDATASECPAGSVVEVAWDFDGDGSIDVSSGASLETDHIYDDHGQWQPRAVITSEYGVQATASAAVETLGAGWVHTWHLEKSAELLDVAVGESNMVYAVGWLHEIDTVDDDLLLLCYDFAGSLMWVRRWGDSSSDLGEDLLVTDTGDVYVVGYTESFGAGDRDVLVQRWDAAGDLIWTRTWGTAGTDQGAAIALHDGVLYAAGKTTGADDGDADVLVLACDTDGNLSWVSTVDAADDEGALDLVASYNLIAETTDIHITGYYGVYPSEALYACFSDTGGLVSCSSWSSSEDSTGYAIAAYQELMATRICISGFMVDDVFGFGECMLLTVGSGSETARLWGQIEEDIACDMVIVGDDVILAGYSRDYMDDGHCCGVLLRSTLDGVLQSAQTYAPDLDVPFAGFFGLAAYTDSGVVIAGFDKLVTGQWESHSANWYDREGTWMDRISLVSVDTPEGSTSEPALQPVAVTEGIEDSPEESWSKALLMASPIL